MAPASGENLGAGAKPAAQDAQAGSQGKAGTGAGAEAAQGIQSAQQGGGTSPEGAKQRGDTGRSGSEPLADREQEHKPSYGGEAGSPRTSSDQRERH